MARWTIAGLVVLNALLALGVYQRLGVDKPALAQVGRGGEHAYVTGTSNGQVVVYDLEVNTGSLRALRTDPVTQKTEVAAKVEVTRALQAVK